MEKRGGVGGEGERIWLEKEAVVSGNGAFLSNFLFGHLAS